MTRLLRGRGFRGQTHTLGRKVAQEDGNSERGRWQTQAGQRQAGGMRGPRGQGPFVRPQEAPVSEFGFGWERQ